jgi:hypothetical protein
MLTTWYDIPMSSASLRCFPVCCSLPPTAPKAEVVELDLAPPAMNEGGFGGGRLSLQALGHLHRIIALHVS